MKNKYTSKYSGYKVLIFGAGGRQALPVCKGFFTLGCDVTAYCEHKLDTGYLTKYVTNRILYSKKSNLDFFSYGKKLIESNQYDLVIPLGDEGAKYLSLNKKYLSEYSKIAVNDWDIFQYAIDKSKTMRVCMENHINAPITLISDNPIRELLDGKIKFPIVVKPCVGMGSIGFSIIQDMDSLNEYLKLYDLKDYNSIVIQEFIEQGDFPQYRADFFRDKCGNYKAAIVGKVTRWYPLDGGSGIYAETIHDEEILKNCKKLLDKINWNGYANIDLVWDIRDNKAKILEINGRTGATIMEDYHAGINISQLILENEMGYDVTDMNEYKDGSRISCFLPDLLWFLKSPNRFKTKPSWFDRKGIKDSVFSWGDIKPSIGFFLSSVFSFKHSMKKRKRIKTKKINKEK